MNGKGVKYAKISNNIFICNLYRFNVSCNWDYNHQDTIAYKLGLLPTTTDESGVYGIQNIETTTFWSYVKFLVGTGGVLAGVGIAIGALVFGVALDTLLYLGVIIFILPTLFFAVTDMIVIYNIIWNVSPILALFIISPLAVMFIFGIIDWARGLSS